MITRHPLFVIAALVTLVCLTSAAVPLEPIERVPRALDGREYVDARDYFTRPEQIDLWYALTSHLKADFDSVCGDTFCEGDYINYESLAFRCSVEQTAGTLGECVWLFAASAETITPSTGEVSTHIETWRCSMPIASDTPASAFLEALSKPKRPLFAPLLETDRSLYDGLIDCL